MDGEVRMLKCRYCTFSIPAVVKDINGKERNNFDVLLSHVDYKHKKALAVARARPSRAVALGRRLDRKLLVDEQGYDQFDHPVPLDRLFPR